MRLPSTSPVTLGFGATTDPYSVASPHNGVDFAYIPDNKIYAPFSGTVTLIANNGRDGNGIYMHNGNEFHGLLHTSKYLVGDGQSVVEGQPIGIMGNTGFALGVHLHWCVKVEGRFIDPMSLLKQENSGMTSQEATAILDSFYWKFTGRKIKDTELAEYVPYFLSGTPDKFFKKASQFDEVKFFVGEGVVTHEAVLDYVNKNLK